MVRLVMWGALAGQFAFGFIAVFALLRGVLVRRPRFLHIAAFRWRHRRVSDRWLNAVKLSRTSPAFKERERLLAGCGFTGDAALYVLGRRLVFLGMPLWAFAAYGTSRLPQIPLPRYSAPALFALLMLFVLWDLPLLESFRKARAERMTKEIYIVSNQLLYLAGSSLHIHTKLMRCVPFTRTMRSDLQQLLGEWYHDAEGALRRFKLRLGTEEGLSFSETIDSLRLHDSDYYYQLLRDRIQDYKEKLELAKESRKESTSYVLFVIAGIPILYMFQIFVFPWVQEGQKLFGTLS